MDIGDLYGNYFDECLQFARTLIQKESEAEDLTQNAFIRAINHLQLLKILSESQRLSEKSPV